MNIIEALNDEKLLGQFIKDPNTWKAWFVFLRAFFGLKPEKYDKDLFRDSTGRQEWPTEPVKEAWLAIGVRGGKSFVVALIATYLAVFKSYKLSPGEKGYILIVAPTKRQAGIIKRYLSSFFADNVFLKPFVTRETHDEIELKNNLIIATLSSNYKSVRGFTAVAAIIDEVAYLSIEGEKPDQEVVRALRSRLMSTGGPLISISSPYAKRGALYDVWKKHYSKNGSNILVWQASSRTMNPMLSKKAIKQAYEEDPTAAKTDYGADFRNDIESYVSQDALDACIVPGRYEIPPVPGLQYAAFVDPSGGSKDSMTLGIGHGTDDGVRLLDAVREVKPPFSPDQVCKDFSELLKRYGVSTVTGDRYAGEWPRERLREHGIMYEVSVKPKSDIYRDFLPLINSGELELLDNGRLISQIINLERRTGRGGKDSIDHAPHGHDDLSNVAAGVLTLETLAWGKPGEIFEEESPYHYDEELLYSSEDLPSPWTDKLN